MKIEIDIETRLNQQQLTKLIDFLKKTLTNTGLSGTLSVSNIILKQNLGFNMPGETLDLGLGSATLPLTAPTPQDLGGVEIVDGQLIIPTTSVPKTPPIPIKDPRAFLKTKKLITPEGRENALKLEGDPDKPEPV